MARDNVKLMFHIPPSGVSCSWILSCCCMPVAWRQPMWLRIASRQGLKCPKLQHFGRQCFYHGISAGKSQSQEEQETIGAMYLASSHNTFVSSKMYLSELRGIWDFLLTLLSSFHPVFEWACFIFMSRVHFQGRFCMEAIDSERLHSSRWGGLLWQWCFHGDTGWYRGQWNWGEWDHRRLVHTDTVQIHVWFKKRMIWYVCRWFKTFCGNVNLSAFGLRFNECLRNSLPRVSKMDWC